MPTDTESLVLDLKDVTSRIEVLKFLLTDYPADTRSPVHAMELAKLREALKSSTAKQRHLKAAVRASMRPLAFGPARTFSSSSSFPPAAPPA
jgi:hypothetical protein